MNKPFTCIPSKSRLFVIYFLFPNGSSHRPIQRLALCLFITFLMSSCKIFKSRWNHLFSLNNFCTRTPHFTILLPYEHASTRENQMHNDIPHSFILWEVFLGYRVNNFYLSIEALPPTTSLVWSLRQWCKRKQP
jgi:hypothetical protein